MCHLYIDTDEDRVLDQQEVHFCYSPTCFAPVLSPGRVLLMFPSTVIRNPVSMCLSPRVFQSGFLWAWWSSGRSCSSSWWGSAGASAAHIAAAVTSAAPAVLSPAAVPGHVSDHVPAWRKSSPAQLLLSGRRGGECASFAPCILLD